MENPAGYVNALLMPIVLSAIDSGWNILSISPTVDWGSLNGASPETMQDVVRSNMDFDGFMAHVLAVYGGLYGKLLQDTGPITNTYERLPMAILYAAMDGATQIEMHKEVVLPVFQNSCVFRSMLNKLSS